MKITVDIVAKGLVSQGYDEMGGSEVYRLLRKTGDYANGVVKIFYDNYNNPRYIIVKDC